MSSTLQVEANNVAPKVSEFHLLQHAVNLNFMALTENQKLFRTDLKKGVLFDAYLAAIPEDQRQQYNCDCCKGFLNRYGSIVTIDPATGEPHSVLWNLTDAQKAEQFGTELEFFLPTIEAMRKSVEGAHVRQTFISSKDKFGENVKGGFHHFAVDNLNVYDPETTGKGAGEVMSQQQQSFAILAQFMGTVDVSILKAMHTYFKHDAELKMAVQHVELIEWAIDFKELRDVTTIQMHRQNLIWSAVATSRMGRLRIGNGVVGEFYTAIKSGVPYTEAKRRFQEMTKPQDYMKPKAPPTEGNKNHAENLIKRMGLSASLPRRHATEADLNRPDMVIWSLPATEVAAEEDKPVFGHVKTKSSTAAPKVATLPNINGGVLTLQRFLAEVLPTSTEVYFEVLAHRKYNFASITQVVDPTSKPILLWDLPEARNPLAPYMYVDGSSIQQWGLSQGRVKVTQIFVEPSAWARPETKAVAGLFFQIEGSADKYLNFTPVNADATVRALHEVRATIQAYYASTPLTALEEGQKPVAGMCLSRETGAHINVGITVVKDGASITYTIDRAN